MKSRILASGCHLWTVRKTVGCALAMFGLAACGTQETPNKLVLASPLDGKWQINCRKLDDTQSARVEYTFANGQMEVNATVFSGTECDSKQSLFLARRQTRYELRGPTEAPLSASKIDYSAPRNWMKPVSQEVNEALNRENAYGLSDWTLEQEFEVTGKGFSGETDVEGKSFSVYKVTGNRLCLGQRTDTHDGRTEANRMNELIQGTECLTKVAPNG